MNALVKKIFILPLILFVVMFVSFVSSNGVLAQEGTKLAYTATKTTTKLETADGIKDEAYNFATVIPVNVVTNDNGNPNPATANMYLLWDDSYIYVFAEVMDSKHYEYKSDALLEERDAFEILLDLYHKADYWLGGYGSEYRNEWYGSGARMCEGLYKIAAGVERASVDHSIQGSHWMWDDQKNSGSYYSKLTETGYTVEMKISVGKDAMTYLQARREIGLGVKIYDKYADDKNSSVVTLEAKNDRQAEGPRYLSNIVLVDDDYTPTAREEVILKNRDTYVANKTSDFIIADGIKDAAWLDAKAIDLIYVRQFANDNVGHMTIYMLWDEDYFYLFAEIEDNTPNACPNSDIFNYNNYDSVGFCIDLLRDTNALNFDTGDYKTSVGFGGDYRGEPGPMCEGFWALTRGTEDLTIGTLWMCDDGTTKAASSFGSVSTENGYTVEMKLYAGNNKEDFMQEGRKIGVGLNVSDQFVEGGNTSATVSHAVLDEKNFPNNDRAWGRVWAQGPSALSEVVLNGYSNESSFESDKVERKEFTASRVLSDTKIKVDGVMDEVYNTTTEFEINTLVSGTTNATAKARVMWTKGYLYVFVDVNDSTISELGLPNVSDGVIVAVDLLGDNAERTSRWGSKETKTGEGIFVANPGQRLFGYGTKILYERYLSRVASIIKEDGSGYTVEMRIELGDNINVEGNSIGLAIVIQDNNDGTNSLINGMVSTNTQQNRVFSYNGVLDNVKLIANSNETKSEIKDADAMDYISNIEDNPAPETPENSETPETPENPETPDDTETPEKEGGCRGSVTTSSTLLIILLTLVSIILYQKKKSGREEK